MVPVDKVMTLINVQSFRCISSVPESGWVGGLGWGVRGSCRGVPGRLCCLDGPVVAHQFVHMIPWWGVHVYWDVDAVLSFGGADLGILDNFASSVLPSFPWLSFPLPFHLFPSCLLSLLFSSSFLWYEVSWQCLMEFIVSNSSTNPPIQKLQCELQIQCREVLWKTRAKKETSRILRLVSLGFHYCFTSFIY